MTPTEIIAQAFGIVAMVFNVLSYQGKKQSTVIAMQMCGSVLFAVNYLMLGATVGGILNIICIVRAVVFLFKDKLRTDHPLWMVGFILVYIAVYILSFTVFEKEVTVFNLIVEVLPVIGMVALTVGYRLKRAADVRKCGLISSPSWLIYNIAAKSVGATVCEILALVSIVVGMVRHDKAKKTEI